MSQSIRIAIVDDRALTRHLLGAQINAEPDMSIVGLVEDTPDTLASIVRAKPDIVVIEIDFLRENNAFDLARQLRNVDAGVRVLFLCADPSDEHVEQMLAVKAWGLLSTRRSYEMMLTAIRDIAGGERYYCGLVRARMVTFRAGDGGEEVRSRKATLTKREREVIRYLAAGKSVKEIANRLHLSPKTVDNHKCSIMQKLDIHDRVRLALYAVREGLASDSASRTSEIKGSAARPDVP